MTEEEMLAALERGEMELSELPPELQKQILGDGDDDVREESTEDEGELPAESTPPVTPPAKADDSAASPATPDKPFTAEERAELLAKTKNLHDEVNKWRQKAEARDRLLSKIEADPKVAIDYLKSKGKNANPGIDPRIDAKLSILTDPQHTTTPPPQETVAVPLQTRAVDETVMEYANIGEPYSSANQKWAQVYEAFQRENRLEDFEKAATDPSYRAEVFKSLGIETIKDFDAYLTANNAVRQWQTDPNGKSLLGALEFYGLRRTGTPSIPPAPKLPPSTPQRRADEVPQLAHGQGTPLDKAADPASRIATLFHLLETAPEKLSKEDRELIYSVL